ncbi:MAG: histidine kinase [Candidatus Eisenbacteria bacterium]|uniref:Histidine kinase n=1 Tax=Eiseniibacteriota bacterium TaxID=2212470 RepID=A0A9D6L917_UNCEI|nr:histidine kinase [Candidatus Eisenbacteria bacterium]MBI3539185.1 histidine kinase [Candidatus Eisenbacteria bacterium]
MHPFFRRRWPLALYLGAWILIGLMFTALVWLAGSVPFERALLVMEPVVLVYGLVCLSAYWVCRKHPAGTTPAPRLANAVIVAALQASAMWVALSAPWSALVTRLGVIRADRDVLLIGFAALFVAGVPLYLISVAVHYLLLTFEASREAERRALESQVAAREAEVRALRAQLNPHFLFNSLNSINALVGAHPEAARRMCESLGDFLRQTLALGARESVSLGEELALVDRYLAIERVRFGERLRVECRLEPAVERCLVPPLLLQPLVENAIKHGIAERIEGGTVRIAAARHDGVLTIEVENDADPDARSRRGAGVGLANVRRRLDALEGRDTRLDVRRIADQFRVTLTLPARVAEGGAGGGR